MSFCSQFFGVSREHICLQLQRLGRSSSSAAVPVRRDWHLQGHPAPSPLAGGSKISQEDYPSPVAGDNEQISVVHRQKPGTVPTPHEHRAHRNTMKTAFPMGWSPSRKLSREAMDGLRALHMFDDQTFSTAVLAEKFHISPEAVRRILKSKWEPTRDERIRLAQRERQLKERKIKLSILEERLKHSHLEGHNRQKTSNEHRKLDRQDHHPSGINAKDRFTFQ